MRPPRTIRFKRSTRKSLAVHRSLVLVDPHAVRHIRRRAENHMITRFQSRTNVDASAIV
jgi:hypothetical protein